MDDVAAFLSTIVPRLAEEVVALTTGTSARGWRCGHTTSR
jgi:hypothetical protein